MPTTRSGLNSCIQTEHDSGRPADYSHDYSRLYSVGLSIVDEIVSTLCRALLLRSHTCTQDIAASSLSRASQALPQILCTLLACSVYRGRCSPCTRLAICCFSPGVAYVVNSMHPACVPFERDGTSASAITICIDIATSCQLGLL